MVIIPDAGKLARMDAIRNILTWRLHLFTNAVVPGPNTVFTDLTLANFSGYAFVVAAFGFSLMIPGGKAMVRSQAMVFAHNGGAVSNLVRGWALSAPADAKLHALDLLPVPKLFASAADQLTITITQTHTQEP